MEKMNRFHKTGQDKSTNFGQVVTIIEKTMYRCNKSTGCLDKVLNGDHVYIHVSSEMKKKTRSMNR